MRIAQVAPLVESVPPHGYGGTERIVAYLSDELVKQGHDVTLFASGDSLTRARLVSCAPEALRLDEGVVDQLAHMTVQLERVAALADTFDLIHWHIDYFHFPMSRRLGLPQLTTLHGRLDIPDLQPVYDEFTDMPVVSISDDQRRPLPQGNWLGTVHHGLPPDELTPIDGGGAGNYLAFLGRISPEKRADRAIEVARRTGMELRIAAKVDTLDEDYFEREIEPLLAEPHVEWVGEIGGAEKHDFLARARALLFPIDWSEPFGLVMIEAMACGTPVIAYNHGSVPEVLTPGVSGYIVESIDEAVEAVQNLDRIDRGLCRAAFEARFTAERMATDYVALYERLLAERGEVPLPPWAVGPRDLVAGV